MTTTQRQPTATLFAQLLALIVFSLIGALTINLLVVLNLPPPTPDFYRMNEIAQVLKGGSGAMSSDRRPLVSRLSDSPPVTGLGPPGLLSPGRTTLAGLLGANPSDLVISNDYTPFSDRRQFLICDFKHVVMIVIQRSAIAVKAERQCAVFERHLGETVGRIFIFPRVIGQSV